MIVFLLIVALLIAIVAVVFALQNAEVVSVLFFTAEFEGSLALILLVTFVAGVLVGVLLVLPSLVKVIIKSQRLSRELAKAIESKEVQSISDSDSKEDEGEFDEF